MFIYHVTRPHWLTSDVVRLGFHCYQIPPDADYNRNHEPLIRALESNKESNVYVAFFFHNEADADSLCSTSSELEPTVTLRVDKNDSCFIGFSEAADDREKTEGAHMRYRIDSISPEKINYRLLHPTWGVPLASLEIKTHPQGEWQSLAQYISNPIKN